MDTCYFKKKCPRCNTEIEPKRIATAGDEAFSGMCGAGGAAIGFTLGGPVGAIVGAAVSYFGNKKAIMSIKDHHDKSQWFKYKCPKCGCQWKEKIHTNDDPEDPSWINAAY